MPAAASSRLIVHADLDAFFASVAQLDDPALRGKPVLIGGRGPRGVVAAASYEARAFGCHSAMPTSIALRRCPHAIIARPAFERYRELSQRVYEVLGRYSPLIQPMGLDEAYLDMTGTERALGPPAESLARLKHDVRAETGLTISIGAGPNKFVAKIASDLDKPDGLALLLDQHTVERTLWPMPATTIPGVGDAAAKRLTRLGVRTIGHIARLGDSTLASILGDWGAELAARARGEDDRPVTPDRTAKSIGHERTFGTDVDDAEIARTIIADQAEQVARRLRAHHRVARTVTVKLRLPDFTTFTRAATLPVPSSRTDAVTSAARDIFEAWASRSFRPLRLLGVSASNLAGEDAEQPGLFDQGEAKKQRALDAAADSIADKFGKSAIRRGSAVRRDEAPDLPEESRGKPTR